MNIAVMTWFYYHNYGTALQVFALCEYLRQNGHRVDIIDYHPGRLCRTITDYSFFSVLKRIGNRFNKRDFREKSDSYFSPKNRENNFVEFLNRNTFTLNCDNLADLQRLNSEYDAFICGSDQIWSPNNFDPHYFLDFVKNTSKMIAYAPSIGLMTISDQYVFHKMRELIGRFKSLSVREEQGQKLIKNQMKKDAAVVLDPSFLLTKEQWTLFCPDSLSFVTEKPYLAVYMLGINENHWEEIYHLAKEKNLDVKVIPVFEGDVLRNGVLTEAIGPNEFINLIQHASYVCTDSFHGTVFSIIFHKNFSVFERFTPNNPINQNSRVFNILKLTNLENRLVPYGEKIINSDAIDYQTVDFLVNEKIIHSKKYLHFSLDQAQKTNQDEYYCIQQLNKLCCGCGVCAYVCSQNAICIQLDDDGFLKPLVRNEKCKKCGKCTKVCPFEITNKGKKSNELDLYSYKDYDVSVLQKSSSGGFAFRLSNILMDNGYAIVGSTFDVEEQIAKHILIESKDELNKLQSSKYLQSDFSAIFEKVQNINKPLAIFGTPCQIAAVKRVFVNRNDIVYIDLICHGVPTYNLYKKYKDYLVKEHHLAKDKLEICFRDKSKGWRERYIYTSSGRKEISLSQFVDPFFRVFESTSAYADACYDCRWRDNTVADIRIGDYWGPKFEDDNTGVSMVACATQKGKDLIKLIKQENSGEILTQPIEDYLNYQQQQNELMPLFHDELIHRLSDEKTDINLILEKYISPFERNRNQNGGKYRHVMKMMIDDLRMKQ